MSPTINELEAAFNRCKLRRLGYTLQSALACDALKTCLVCISINMQKQAATALPKHPTAPHWTDKY